MSGVAGNELKYAIKKATAWGTAVQCGAGDGFLSLPTGIKRESGIDIDDSLGLFVSQDGTPSAVTVPGDLPLYLRYDGCGLIMALFMGIAGIPTLVDGATGAYAYAYDFAESTDGLFATFARHRKHYIDEVPSLKISALTIKGEQGKPLQLVATVIGNNLVADGVNKAATYSEVTIAETRNRVQFAQGVFRMNDKDDVALGAPHVVTPSSFEITAKRQLEGMYGAFTTGGTNPQDLIDEPTNNGVPEFSVTLQFPRHTGKTRLDELGGDARKKMDITFTGREIEAGFNRQIKFELPHLQYKSVDVVDESGNIKEPVEFVAHGVTAAVAGMTDLTMPLRISGVNQRNANPLA
ncbi:phage tail tube protein [Desulfuromonas acetoxidans]|uniref:phage tail tube protein n=1 Tax=Desulfuromonas acetoxidans TaxID=891 RepID=UPI002930280D|nr:phage tail tube protein [Desulfuromonas acetoxidans]